MTNYSESDIPDIGDLEEGVTADDMIEESASLLSDPESSSYDDVTPKNDHAYVSTGGCDLCDSHDGDIITAEDADSENYKSHDNCECTTEESQPTVEIVSLQEVVDELKEEVETLESDYMSSFNSAVEKYEELEVEVDRYNGLQQIASMLYDDLKTDGFDLDDYQTAYSDAESQYQDCEQLADIYNSFFDEAYDLSQTLSSKLSELDSYHSQLESAAE